MGIKIKEIREKRNMTQSELARKSGVSRQTINEIENNIEKKPTVKTLEKLAEGLGVTLDRIFFGEGA